MINVAICDDEKFYIDKTEEVLKNFSSDFNIFTYHNGNELLAVLGKNSFDFDIYIIDIEMPNIDGMKTANLIKAYDKDSIVILLTNHDKYVYDAFKIEIFRYIQKNIMNTELMPAMEDAIEKLAQRHKEDYIVYRNGLNSFGKLKCSSIVYIEKIKKYVAFYIDDNTVIRERTTISNVQNRLNPNYFVLINKGLLVNIAHVKLFEKTMIKMDNGAILYMGREYVTKIKKSMLNFWGK